MTQQKQKGRLLERLRNTKSSVINVREIEGLQDTVNIMQMAKDFVAETDFETELDPSTIHLNCIRVQQTAYRNSINVFIAYKSDKAVGFIVGTCFDLWYKSGRAAEQKLWYVKPEHRNSQTASQLLLAFEEWAISVGATQIYTGSTNARYSETISSIVEKLGYDRVGSLHMKVV